jgi:indolepyruvate ferredoxin oxidoreductase beta subunit
MSVRETAVRQQLIISGVGGQGILFLTRLLAETAIHRGLPVISSETHGMAQRGGVVVSHLKVGGFPSPLVRAGAADGMLVLNAGNFRLQRPFLHANGWAAMNSPTRSDQDNGTVIHTIDADRIARESGLRQGTNLILLGFLLAHGSPFPFFCTADDIRHVLESKQETRAKLVTQSLRALQAGIEYGNTYYPEAPGC